MSGIEEIKRKAKMSLDEMFDNSEDNTDFRKLGKSEVRKEVKVEDKTEVNTSYHFPSHEYGKTKEKMDCKLTFNVNADTFKAFNEIYAKRILEGRKTEKSILICEAIQLLYDRENQ